MKDEVGEDNIFIFGLKGRMSLASCKGIESLGHHNTTEELRQALDMIACGYFSPDAPHRFKPIFEALTGYGDHFLLLADYVSYIACQERVDALYRDREQWSRRAILNVAGMGRFSSDRTIREYAETVWKVKDVEH
jgi:starch phosphorylase